MKRVFGFILAGILMLSACSSGGRKAAGPEASASSENTEASIEAPALTEAVEKNLAAVLDGEPPSTTVSADPDEQAAADAVHWLFQTIDKCKSDTATCVLADFEYMLTGPVLMQYQDGYGESKRVGRYWETDRPFEQTALWARKSKTADHVVGVLSCERSYHIRYNSDGTIDDGTSPVVLFLWRVSRDDDGQWLLSDRFEVDRFQPDSEGGDQCSSYDGSEVSDVQFNGLIA